MDPETRIRLLMTEPVLSVDMDDPPSEVRRLLTGYAVHHLPVVQGGKLVGILSDADLKKLDAFLPRHGASSDDYLNSHISIAKLMSPPLVTAEPDEHVGPVAEKMVRAGVHSAPVVDSNGRLVGILTTTDIISAALQETQRNPLPSSTEAPPRSAESIQALEAVLHAADRYLRGGQDETLHARLLNAIDHAKKIIGDSTGTRGSVRSL
jgi:CBS domain-containing protein